MSSIINEENIINHKIMNEEVIDREELIETLTYILEHDGNNTTEELYISNPEWIPEISGFRDWLIEGITPNGYEFNTLIRKNYIQTYIKDLYWVSGEWNPDECVPHKHINWDVVCEELIETQYEELILDDRHPYNIFRNSFYLRLG